MRPTEASQAIVVQLAVKISGDTLRLCKSASASVCATEADMHKLEPSGGGRETLLPTQEEGLVELVKFVQSSSPPFAVLK